MVSIFGAEAHPTAAYVLMMGEGDAPDLGGNGDDDKIEPDEDDEGDNEDNEENEDN